MEFQWNSVEKPQNQQRHENPVFISNVRYYFLLVLWLFANNHMIQPHLLQDWKGEWKLKPQKIKFDPIRFLQLLSLGGVEVWATPIGSDFTVGTEGTNPALIHSGWDQKNWHARPSERPGWSSFHTRTVKRKNIERFFKNTAKSWLILLSLCGVFCLLQALTCNNQIPQLPAHPELNLWHLLLFFFWWVVVEVPAP